MSINDSVVSQYTQHPTSFRRLHPAVRGYYRALRVANLVQQEQQDTAQWQRRIARLDQQIAAVRHQRQQRIVRTWTAALLTASSIVTAYALVFLTIA